ncbi:uncharacterized protein LOC127082700 [Lathyrus oleraceus]|uniref:uncharacterized protein LOC127082700 n=1 Tax=Pisum sativum TaxID=3888 RepID=UPI0021CFBDA6|nr:uncharacterized protein LOC127082700 [Pisum sativum]
MILVCLYVEDVLLIGGCSNEIAKFKKVLMIKFEMTNLGNMRFELINCKSAITHAETNHKLDYDVKGDDVDAIIFKQLVDPLIYLCNTILDICCAIGLLTSPDIQKDTVKVAATVTTQVILDDLGDDLFAILIDGSRDISVNEKMVVVIRYVNNEGKVIERFFGVVHVSNTSALTLKSGLESLFVKYGLSLSRIRGQASCKRRDILRESQATKVKQALEHGEISSMRGLNQEMTIKKAEETRWSSHYRTLLNIVSLFSSMINVLQMVEEDGTNLDKKCETPMLMNYMQSFEFIFILHLMKMVLEITHDLSQALQRSDQNIVNAMKLVKVSKIRLQVIKDNGWDSLLNDVLLFCEHNNIDITDMNDTFQPTKKKLKRKMKKVSNLHHFQVGLFYEVIDRQLQELNNRFTEVNTELQLCVACLNPRDSFSAFDKERLIRLAQFYPSEFS